MDLEMGEWIKIKSSKKIYILPVLKDNNVKHVKKMLTREGVDNGLQILIPS